MADQVAVDPQMLRAAAGRLDVLFNDSGATLRETDQAIADSRDGWQESAASAFGRFNTYLEGRRTMLLGNLADLAETLKAAADKVQAQDAAAGAAISQVATPRLNI
ncbi:WXG100 family type VII secretion target [Nocardia transvalensis]|uniref:WXG100 family type VII secretion target n=1 Tax=Nocardia transvalensis TaxID=37333 RepID=UPI001895AFAE|nr:WXG100 family type VII secretion target [Nocardia transvalensis]MBF6327506.1 WXG100 family type VII secretion target [Nocardia transvalensis]